jgi:ribosome biogenesis protein UTP30
MAKDKLIDSRVSVKQCSLAVEALYSHELKKKQEQQENELLGPKEIYIWLVVAVKKMYPERKVKPFSMCVNWYSMSHNSVLMDG